MSLDLRIPLGMMFSLAGLILSFLGLPPTATRHSMPRAWGSTRILVGIGAAGFWADYVSVRATGTEAVGEFAAGNRRSKKGTLTKCGKLAALARVGELASLRRCVGAAKILQGGLESPVRFWLTCYSGFTLKRMVR